MPGFGAFGKMPSLGDFFRLGLPPGFEAVWDPWLQHGMLAAREALAERWQACFLSAPIWRFSTAPGVAGPVALQGLLMASVDRVGRMFPLTLVAPLDRAGARDVVTAHLGAEACFAALETIALDALDDGMTPQALSARLGDLAWVTSAAAANAVQPLAGAVALRSGGDLATALASHLGAVAHPLPSVWTAVVAGETRLFLCGGLPSASAMAAFYDIDAALWQTAPTEGAFS